MSDPAATESERKGLLPYLPELAEEIFQFQRETYPDRDPALIAPRWKWMFLDSAHRLGIEPYVWVYRRQGAIVAHQGAIAVEFQLAGHRRKTGWFVETMAHESVRGKAIGPMVIKKALDDLPFNLSLGQTEQMRSLQFALGWQQVAPLRTYALILHPLRVLAGKMANPITRLAASAALATRRIAKRLLYRAPGAGNLTTRAIERFDASHDRFWSRVEPRFKACVVRDAAFLNWKFADQPGQSFRRLEIRQGDEPRALVIFAVREAEGVYHYRRAIVMDWIVDPADRPAVRAALEALVAASLESQVDAIFFDLLERDLERELVAYGFLPRDASRVLLLATGGLSDEERADVMNPGHWLVTRADSDIDRPW